MFSFNCLQGSIIVLLPNKWIIISVGPEGSTGLGPFHSKSKVHTEKEEVSEDEQRESILPDCTAEDDPVLGRPKS